MQAALATAVESAIDVGRKQVQIDEAHAELERMFADGGLHGRLTGEQVGVYRLGPMLGRGGSGEVYDAFRLEGGGRAAVKVLNSTESDDLELISRFEREGEIAMSIRSPNVVRVEQYGRTQYGQLFIAMERLQGRDLAAILRKKGQMAAETTCGIVNDVCRALFIAHQNGIIHRDIKPHNLFEHRNEDGSKTWKVLDFGVSRWMEESSTLTQGGVVGTPQYMSPEQSRRVLRRDIIHVTSTRSWIHTHKHVITMTSG